SSSKLARDQTFNPTSFANPTLKGRIRRSSKQKVENSHFEEHLTPVATMTDNRTMAEMLRAPTEWYAEAIIAPSILAEQFELKHSLINMMTSEQFFGLEKDNTYDHIRWFNKITSTIKYKDVPNSVIKLILFPFSLAGAARRWLEKEPPHSFTTWDDLVLKFINEFFPPSRTTNLRNEISNFQQKFDESFHEAWERYKDLLRACPHHGFTELHQLDTFYNALNPADQDSLNATAGGNLLEKSPQDAYDSLNDNIIFGLPPFFAITPDEPVLSTEEPDNSLSMGDEHLDTIPATESDEFIKSGVDDLIPIPSESEGIPKHKCDVPSHDNSPPLDVSTDHIKDFSESNKECSSIDDDSFSIDNIDYVEASPPDSELVNSEVMEIVIPEVGGIDDDILLMIKHDVLREKLLNVTLLISKIKALNANPTLSFDCKTMSSSTSLNSLLEETNTFDNSLPKFETFCFDVEEISSGSTTTYPDISLSEYEAFHDDHVKEISSGSPTTPSDSPLYASFMFDLLINPFPPADRSDFYEFIDELIPFISPPEYDCFLFKDEPNSRDFTKDVVEDILQQKNHKFLLLFPPIPPFN
nr:reverse transcriptase domain-containing protein [Tanacetum cinerariifolium]